MTHPLIEGLNKEQALAVTTEAKHTLVLAGAGSGKTRVLTTRMAWLIQTAHVSPHAVLAVTFTNKAAKEMLSRLSSMLPINTRGMWVGTFHGLCNRFLRTHHQLAGLPQLFQILDSSDQLSAIKRMLKANNIDDDRFPARDVQRMINAAKEDGLRPSDMDISDRHARNLAELYQKYQDQCDKEGVVDFGELLLRSFEILEKDASIREHYQHRFQHILVDEFQDTNVLQYKWLMLLAGPNTPVFAVGDDDQSIYAFRGANVGNMADFEAKYARGNVIRLEQNYRSQSHILDAANGLISHNNNRLGKNLWTDSSTGDPIRIIEQANDHLEAEWVVDEIKSLIREGYAADEIAILYRSNAQSRSLEHVLFSSGLPYRVYGGLRFFERQEIKHVLAYLRLIDNPNDDTSFMRVVNFPTRGIGARTLEQLVDAANLYSTSLYTAIAYVRGTGGTKLAGFASLIHSLTEQADKLDLPDLISQIVEQTGLYQHYKQDKEGQDRLDNLQEMINAAAIFAGEEGYSGLMAKEASKADIDLANIPVDIADDDLTTMSALTAFLSHASLEAGEKQAQAGEKAVQLMTVHAAKGLEFDAVFITGLEEGLFPHENSLLDAGGLEEERRLMYVAITRARKRLTISLAQSRMLHGKTRYAQRSRFLEEIPEANTKWLSPKSSNPDNQPWRGAFRRGMGDWQAGHSLTPKTPRSSTTVVTVGDNKYRIGQSVRHKRFGEGTIVHISGAGMDAQARIEFSDVGSKTLALGIAKLEII